MRSSLFIATFVLFVGVGFPFSALAVPIEYIEQTVGSGSLGATAFSNANVTFTLSTDTTTAFSA